MAGNNIEFDNVSFVFDGKVVIDSFFQSIPSGEHVAFMGESGAGKSTLLNSIVGLTVPDSGTVNVSGMVVNHTNIARIRALCAWIPQELSLPYGSVEELLVAPYSLKVNKMLKFDKERALSLMEQVGLEGSIFGKRFDTISGGEKQRLVLISALLLDKKILLLDEPTSALDPLSRDKLTTFLKSLENTTIVAITHDIGFAGQLDRIINLKKN